MNTEQLIKECEIELKDYYEQLEDIALFNQEKVLEAFRNNRVALNHFSSTSGYGYDDIGRQTLCNLFKDIFVAEEAIVSPLFASGTHTIATALFGALRPGDKILSISGVPYDTLLPVIKGESSTYSSSYLSITFLLWASASARVQYSRYRTRTEGP